MHDTTSQAVKQESKRKRGFCVKVPLVIIPVMSEEQPRRNVAVQCSLSALLFGSHGKNTVYPLSRSVPRLIEIQNVIQLLDL